MVDFTERYNANGENGSGGGGQSALPLLITKHLERGLDASPGVPGKRRDINGEFYNLVLIITGSVSPEKRVSVFTVGETIAPVRSYRTRGTAEELQIGAIPAVEPDVV